jgi:3-phenylpropionate/trans-cinnamate dioxygenase ferredoxin reductase component
MEAKRFVIIGGGLAGGNVAVGLREEGFDGEIIILGDEPGLPFGRPPLSKTYLRGKEDLDGWLVKPSDWYQNDSIDLRPDSRATGLDPSGGRVLLEDGEIVCDAICIATGCRPKIPGIEGIHLEGVIPLRRKVHADAIKAQAGSDGAKAVIAGMSFIGSEVAASLRQLGTEVTAVFPGGGPLVSVLGKEVSGRLTEIHRRKGVELIPQDEVVSFVGKSRVEAAKTESGRHIECSFAVLAAGVEPNVEFLAGSQVQTDNGVLVDASCRTNIENVFAVGDVANHHHPIFGRIRIEHYNNAEKQGRHVARSMLGSTEPYDYVHTFWSDQYAHKIEYVGYAKQWDEFVIRGGDERFIGFYLKDGIMRAAVGLDRGGDPEMEPDSELAACVPLIRDGTPVDLLQLRDEAVDLPRGLGGQRTYRTAGGQ